VLSDLADWVTDVIDALGYVGVALLVALENVFPPIPSEVVLPFAGFVASDGDANLIGMIVAATIGSLVGALVLYGVSAWIGADRVGHFVVRYGRWLRITESDVAKAEGWFDRHSNRAVLLCRCIPLVRSLISIPAGLRRMSLGPFVIYTVIGSAIWNTVMIGSGFVLRSNWSSVEPVLSWFQYLVVATIVVAFAWFVWSRRRNRSAV
jgi:membrane protein DedA with SNARE-associated domain